MIRSFGHVIQEDVNCSEATALDHFLYLSLLFVLDRDEALSTEFYVSYLLTLKLFQLDCFVVNLLIET